MSESFKSNCPPLAALLRVSDGEASLAERRLLSPHLWHCAKCRDRLSALESLAEECASVVDPVDAGTNASVGEFVAGLHQHVRAKPVSVGGARRWLPAAVVVPAMVFLLLLSRSHTVVVQAEELLTRALQVESADPAPASAARVRWLPLTSAFQPSRREASAMLHSASDDPSGAAAVDPVVVGQLREHGIELGQTLSIKPFRTWRAGLSDRRDVVIELDDLIVLRTSTSRGRIRAAEVAVRRHSYILVRETFILDGLGRLDIERRADNEARVPGSLASEPPRPPEHSPADRGALEYAELRARLALRASDLDLGDTVRLDANASTGVVRIEGSASMTARRAVSDALADVPGIDLAIAVGTPALNDVTMPAMTPGLTRWLDRTYGPDASDAKLRFVPELRRDVMLVVKRLAILDELARRYPARAVRSMTSARGSLLRTLVDRHHAALAETLNSCGARIAVLSGTTPSLPVAQANTPSDWRTRVTRARVPAADLGRLLREPMFEKEQDSSAPGDPTAVAILSAFVQLWVELNRP